MTGTATSNVWCGRATRQLVRPGRDRMRYHSYTGNKLVAIRDSAGSNVLYSGGFRSGGFAIRLP